MFDLLTERIDEICFAFTSVIPMWPCIYNLAGANSSLVLAKNGCSALQQCITCHAVQMQHTVMVIYTRLEKGECTAGGMAGFSSRGGC